MMLSHARTTDSNYFKHTYQTLKIINDVDKDFFIHIDRMIAQEAGGGVGTT